MDSPVVATYSIVACDLAAGQWGVAVQSRFLAAELRERLARLGYEGDLQKALPRWAGNANLEERVDGVERIDPVVLEALRRA